MTKHTLRQCEELIDNYINELNGQRIQLEEGSLGFGKILLHGGKDTCAILITEYFISAWRSGHKVRRLYTMPEKYQKIIDES
jgi:hypothetical protein